MSDFIEFGVPSYFDSRSNSPLLELEKIKIDILFSKFIFKKNEIAYVQRIINSHDSVKRKIENNIYFSTIHDSPPQYGKIACSSEEEADDVFDNLSHILTRNKILDEEENDRIYISPSIKRIKYILYTYMDKDSFNRLINGETEVYEIENKIYNNIHISNEDKIKEAISCSYESWKYKIRLILERINKDEFVYKSNMEVF